MKQYYYLTPGCPAKEVGDKNCTCWHDPGTGPFPAADPAQPTFFDKLLGFRMTLSWRDKPQEFKREIRYHVFKRSDINKLSYEERLNVARLLSQLDDAIKAPKRQYVVVEEDWPEYEKVWQMIEARVTGVRIHVTDDTTSVGEGIPESLSPHAVATHVHTRTTPSDEVHPNEEGRRRIAEAVARELNITLPPRVSPGEPSVTYTPPIKLDKGGRLEVTKPAETQRLLYLHCANCHRVTFTEPTNTICSQCGKVNAESSISPHMVGYIEPAPAQDEREASHAPAWYGAAEAEAEAWAAGFNACLAAAPIAQKGKGNGSNSGN